MPEVVVSSKGQIVLPKDIREALGLREGDRVRVEVEGDHAIIRPIQFRAVGDWRGWRGRLSGTRALEDHLAEHADEVKNERLP